jgi:hypothetical protein
MAHWHIDVPEHGYAVHIAQVFRRGGGPSFMLTRSQAIHRAPASLLAGAGEGPASTPHRALSSMLIDVQRLKAC